MRLLYLLLILLISISCNTKTVNEPKAKVPAQQVSLNDDFGDYWYAGKAEVSSYELTQARYGELRNGNAVLIFVTEPFSKEKQVKLDNPQRAGDDKVTVMKLNFTKKFETGIYPYSMMLSAFTPVDRYNFPSSLKTTMSGQEWCGQVFAQMNLKNEKYHVQSFSYFESEGDNDFEIENALLEDEIWNMIRLDYTALPTGSVTMIPGLFATRLMHKPLEPMKTKAALVEKENEGIYTIEYPNNRTLSITFSLTFPHKILSWEEKYPGIGGKVLTTSGKLKESLYIDYWNKNSNADSHLRDSLLLP